MTKKLEDLFNLPDTNDSTVFNDLTEPPPDLPKVKKDALETMDRINDALPTVRGLDADDNEMDELANLAKSSYADLIDLGMQVDSRSAGDILGIASQFLGHAITAKTAKMNKKLKMIDMQLKKAKLEADKIKNSPEQIEESTGTIMDRNELLAELLNRQQENK